MKSLGASLLLLLSALAQSAPPAPPAPQVRVFPDIKLLRFAWASVPGVHHYELWYRASSNAAWRKLVDRPDYATYAAVAVSVHLTDWRDVRYRVDACDLSECTPSESIALDQLMPSVVGYFNPTTTLPVGFGASVTLSADGRTLAAGGTELVGSYFFPMVYVYRRVGSTWAFEARLVPQLDPPVYGGFGNHALALSGDGSVLTVGTMTESVPGDDGLRGSAHVFRRVGGTWQLEQKLFPANRASFSAFGRVVEMDDAGTRIAVLVADATNEHLGEVHLYQRVAATWVLERTFPMTPGGASDTWYCDGLALSGDGQRLARNCGRSAPRAEVFVQTYSAPAWTPEPELVHGSGFTAAKSLDLNADGTRLAAAHSQATSMWRWTAAGWQPDGATGALTLISGYSEAMSLSRNGNFVAIGDPYDATRGLGAIYPPFVAGQGGTGTVRVFERRATGWTLRQALKSNTGNTRSFGFSLALGDNGTVLAVEDLSDSSTATGIGGNPFDTSSQSSGAVWLY